MNTTTPLTRIAGLGAAIVAIDLTTKALATTVFASSTTGLVVPVRNPDFSLGLASAPLPAMVALMATGIVIATLLAALAVRAGRLAAWVPALLIGGSLANLIDRTVTGAVHDFLATPWAVLNLADLAVIAGVTGLWTTHHRTRQLIGIEGR